MSAYHSFEGTNLFDELQRRKSQESVEAVRFLRTVMLEIEPVLKSGGTAPLDFTLHDEGHSFRVAQQMVEIVPEDVLPALSEYELNLLILAAYLHDIGMTPERGKVQQLYKYLLTGTEDALSVKDKGELQEWLDDHAYGNAATILEGVPKSGQLAHIEQIVTHYCRHKHNDWSEDWIREHLSHYHWANYAGWVEDIVQLCRSHHEGYQELIGQDFDPKLVGGGPLVVHLRYLACVLRVADIMEFDPERTPEVIFQHRSVAKASSIFWYKDQIISRAYDKSRKQLLISAQPPDARLHRAILAMIEDINAELTLCRRIADETHFEKFPGPLHDMKHRWDWPYAAHDDVRPKGDAYVYIDGAFRPDTQKILQLLSGQQLYGSPYVAIRELLQNAFDATKELIARELLQSPDRIDPSKRLVSSDRYEVHLSLRRDGDSYFISCSDQGVGMSKSIIEKYLLVSGATERHDILELERRCEKAGFQLGRTGEFGIGVLSYFMLASQVVIVTRRHPLCGDPEANGWKFETEGVGYFGELRKDNTRYQGTEVVLRVPRSSFARKYEDFADEIADYLTANVVWTPCRLTFSVDGVHKKSFQRGWTRTDADLREMVVESLRPGRSDAGELPEGLLSAEGKARRRREVEHWQGVVGEAAGTLRLQTVDGDLPEELGHYRVTIPFFDLLGGSSLGFLRILQREDIYNMGRMGKGFLLIPKDAGITAWRGMKARTPHRARGREIVEINWNKRNAGSISVSRAELHENEAAVQALSWLRGQVRLQVAQLVGTFEKSIYHSLNSRIANSCKVESPYWRSAWSGEKDSPSVFWSPIPFPATVSTAFVYGRYPTGLKWRDKDLFVLPSLGGPDDGNHYDGLSWCSPTTVPDRVVFKASRHSPSLMPLWEGTAPTRDSDLLKCDFPPDWPNLCGVCFPAYAARNDPTVVWNRKHELVVQLDPDDFRAVTRIMKPVSPDSWLLRRSDPLLYRSELLNSPRLSAAFIGFCISQGGQELWSGRTVSGTQHSCPPLGKTPLGKITLKGCSSGISPRPRYEQYPQPSGPLCAP